MLYTRFTPLCPGQWAINSNARQVAEVSVTKGTLTINTTLATGRELSSVLLAVSDHAQKILKAV